MLLGKFTTWVIKEIIEQAEQEYYSPEAIQRELSQWQYRLESGEITREEYREVEKKLFDRLMEGRERRIEG